MEMSLPTRQAYNDFVDDEVEQMAHEHEPSGDTNEIPVLQ